MPTREAEHVKMSRARLVTPAAHLELSGAWSYLQYTDTNCFPHLLEKREKGRISILFYRRETEKIKRLGRKHSTMI